MQLKNILINKNSQINKQKEFFENFKKNKKTPSKKIQTQTIFENFENLKVTYCGTLFKINFFFYLK